MAYAVYTGSLELRRTAPDVVPDVRKGNREADEFFEHVLQALFPDGAEPA